jgi:hypothetical protein
VQNDPKGYFYLAKVSFLGAPAKMLEAMAHYDYANIPEATFNKVDPMLKSEELSPENV